MRYEQEAERRVARAGGIGPGRALHCNWVKSNYGWNTTTVITENLANVNIVFMALIFLKLKLPRQFLTSYNVVVVVYRPI